MSKDSSSTSSSSSSGSSSSSSESSLTCSTCKSSADCKCSSNDKHSSTDVSSKDKSSDEYPREYNEFLKCEKPLDPSEIFYTKRAAVVAIQTLTRYTLPGAPNPVVTNTGTGFFIGNNYILTTAEVVLYRFQISIRNPPAPSPPGPSIVRVNQIFVHVVAVNGDKSKNLIYEADLIGLDGAANVALLHIGEKLNKDLPRLKDQPHLRFARSRDYCIGRTAYIIGNDVGDDTQTIRGGLVTNNRQFSKVQGSPPVELVTLDFPAYLPSNFGAPILTDRGDVIGILNNSYTEFAGTNIGGTSEFFLKPIIDALLEGGRSLIKGGKLKCFADHLNLVIDPVGNYFLYVKGYLGIAWTVYSPLFYIDDAPGYKKTQGVIIVAIDTDTPLGQIFAPLIDAGNNILITDIDGCPIGNIPPQITPADVTWRKVPGQKVKVTYRSSSDGFVGCQAVTVALGVYPNELDLPGSFWMAPNPVKNDAKSDSKTDGASATKSDVKTESADTKHSDAATMTVKSETASAAMKSETKVVGNFKVAKNMKYLGNCATCRITKIKCVKCVPRQMIS